MEIKDTIKIIFKETDKMNNDTYMCMDDKSIIEFLKKLEIYDLYTKGARQQRGTCMLPLVILTGKDNMDIFFISKHSIKEESGEWSCMMCLDFMNKGIDLYPAISILEHANGADPSKVVFEIIKQIKGVIKEKKIEYRFGTMLSHDIVKFFWDKTRPELN